MAKTTEQYKQELLDRGIRYICLGEYTTRVAKTLHKCPDCSYEWYPQPRKILEGSGCPKCAGILQKTHEQYLQELAIIQPTIKPLEKYQTTRFKIKHQCLECNHIWNVTPHSFISKGVGCPVCRKRKADIAQTKTHEQYEKELNSKYPTIIVLEKYIRNSIPIKHKCLVCEYEWRICPLGVLQRRGKKSCCPNCNAIKSQSPQEKILVSYLKRAYPNLEIKQSVRDIIKNPKTNFPLELDIYIPQIKFAIEVNGEWWHSDVNIRKTKGMSADEWHNLKTRLCAEKGIRLIHISDRVIANELKAIQSL